jgi:hypothetical protein
MVQTATVIGTKKISASIVMNRIGVFIHPLCSFVCRGEQQGCPQPEPFGIKHPELHGARTLPGLSWRSENPACRDWGTAEIPQSGLPGASIVSEPDKFSIKTAGYVNRANAVYHVGFVCIFH